MAHGDWDSADGRALVTDLGVKLGHFLLVDLAQAWVNILLGVDDILFE